MLLAVSTADADVRRRRAAIEFVLMLRLKEEATAKKRSKKKA